MCMYSYIVCWSWINRLLAQTKKKTTTTHKWEVKHNTHMHTGSQACFVCVVFAFLHVWLLCLFLHFLSRQTPHWWAFLVPFAIHLLWCVFSFLHILLLTTYFINVYVMLFYLNICVMLLFFASRPLSLFLSLIAKIALAMCASDIKIEIY